MISGIPISKALLEQLKKKLNVGNLRSIQLNCIPGSRKTRLDITDTKDIDTSIPDEFLKKLFNHKNKFNYSISFDNLNLNIESDSIKQKALGVLSTRLNRLNEYNKEDFQEYGYESFGFGFPVVVFRPQEDPYKLIRAPLFIWHFSITKDRAKTNSWQISRDLDQEIEFNNLLRSYLGELSDTKIEGFNSDELKDGVLDFDELIKNTAKFIKIFDSTPKDKLTQELKKSFKNGIEPIPSSRDLKKTATLIPKIYWGGVFGRYHLRNEAIRQEMRQDMLELLEELDGNEEDSNVDSLMHSETAAKTDPSQLGILNYLKKNRHVIIQGPPGTGKSESITGIIVNALEHQRTCLVVCEKKTAMEVLKQNLHDIHSEIGKLAAVIEDVATDRKGVVNSVRDRLERHSNRILEMPSSSNLTEKLELIEDKIRDIKRRKSYLYKTKVIEDGGKKGWTYAVGKHLKARRLNGKSSLRQILESKSIDKDEIEYQRDLNFLKGFEQRSLKINYRNTLSFISDEKIAQNDAIILKDELSELLLQKPSELDQFLSKFEEYLGNKKDAISKQIDKRLNKIEQLSNELEDTYQVVVQQSIFHKNNWWFKVLKTIRGITKNFKTQVDSFLRVPSIVSEINQYLSEMDIVIQLENNLSIEALERNLKLVRNTIDDKRDNISSIKKTTFNSLFNGSFCGIELNPELLEKFKEWMDNSEPFFKEYSEAFDDNDFKSFERSLNQLKWYLICSQDFKYAKKDGFFDHFDWQQEYRKQSKAVQEIISTFLEYEIDNWEMQFNEYYINEKLKDNFSTLTGGYDTQLILLKEERNQLIKEIKARIPQYWKAKQTEVNQQFNIRKLYNKRGSKGSRRNSLRKIAKRSFESLTSYFPVMMVSPSVCASMFDLEPNLFDYVIFDEASQLKTEESLSTLIRGKRKVVSGDDKQMPPSYWFTKVNTEDLNIEDEEEFDPYQSFNEELKSVEGAHDLANSESLLHFAELCDFQSYNLDFHYRSHHPLLIEFSNAAFYKSRLNPLPEKINQSPIQFIPVNGVNHNQQNKDEANCAVEILKNIKRDKEGKLPTVGIATFNKKQKNLMWDVFKREIQIDDDFNKRFTELEENGLFVKNLENIQGDERDVILLSTTFGKDKDGNFSRFYGPLNRSKLGRRLINVIVTRAKKKIFVLTSVPKEIYTNYRQELGEDHESERGYFHAYLAYAKAVSKNNAESIKSILNFLKNRNRTIGDSYNLTESPFEEAVYQALQQEINHDRITLQHKSGGFRIDIAIRSKKTGREYIAIECDGATYHSSAEEHAWDMYRQEILEDNGFIFHRIWSRDWWENPDRELDKVVRFIRMQDEKDPGNELFEDPAAEDIDLSPLLRDTKIYVKEKETDGKVVEQVDHAEVDEASPTKEKLEKETESILRQEPQQVEIDYKSDSEPTIDIGQVINLKYLHDDKEVKVKLSKNTNGVKEENGVMILDEKSPIGAAILGEKVGETVEIGGLEKYCKIISVQPWK